MQCVLPFFFFFFFLTSLPHHKIFSVFDQDDDQHNPKGQQGGGETQAWRSFLKPGHRLKIDSLTSLTISHWRWQQCVLYRATQAGNYKVTSTGYQMSRKVKDMRALCTVCLPSLSHGTFFLILKASSKQRQHFVQNVAKIKSWPSFCGLAKRGYL